jgi:hypothetical protein
LRLIIVKPGRHGLAENRNNIAIMEWLCKARTMLMQSIDFVYTALVEEVDGARTRTAMIRSVQTERGAEACFMTDKRLSCPDLGCEWRRECCRLVAVWRR